MRSADAVGLLAMAIPGRGGTWADLGAGEGVFTRALAELLGPDSRIYAVDRDARAIAALGRWAKRDAPNVIPVQGDFTGPFELPGLGRAALDGLLLANSLHYVREPGPLLARLASRLSHGGRVVLVEYDRRGSNPWVPFPIPATRLPELAASAGLSMPTIVARRPSNYGGDLYVAVAAVATPGLSGTSDPS